MTNEKLLNIRHRLLDGIIDFMSPDDEESDPDFDCGYTQADVNAFLRIIDVYLVRVANIKDADQAEILGTIQDAIEQLNRLNNSCNGSLIETDQREDLCELLLVAGKLAGLETDHDVTVQWREW